MQKKTTVNVAIAVAKGHICRYGNNLILRSFATAQDDRVLI
jgi:hypothetical protein